ncbi:response regulator [Eggerthellaceae bacterium zg-887]|nr:response regulator [Xiamenia xianingshaonis]
MRTPKPLPVPRLPLKRAPRLRPALLKLPPKLRKPLRLLRKAPKPLPKPAKRLPNSAAPVRKAQRSVTTRLHIMPLHRTMRGHLLYCHRICATVETKPGRGHKEAIMARETNRGVQASRNFRNSSFRLPTVVAVLLIVLLLVFYATAFTNVNAITGSIESLRATAYPVSVAAGRVETLLVQLGTIAERPVYARSTASIESLRETYDSINENLQKNFDVILENHTGHSEEEVEGIKRGYATLQSLMEEYIALCADESASDEDVAKFNRERLTPLVNHLLAIDVGVLAEATDNVDDLYTYSLRLGNQTLVWASVLMAAVLAALTIYLTLLGRWRRQQEHLQESLEQALVMAENANEAKSVFLSNMSHDIRTPMNAIVGLTTIARSHLDDSERTEECLERIALASKHLLCLINDVLDMSKIESGKIALNEDAFNFPESIDEVVTIVQPQVRAKHLHFEVVTHNMESERVVGDSMRINQALVNLIGNAVKYTPPQGTVRFTISEGPSDLSGCRLFTFVVQDTGIGMSKEFVKRMFDPFERESEVEQSNIEGTGLGMAITKNVIAMMGGTIEVESELGVGSTFAVKVPLRVAPEPERPDMRPLRGRRVLVIDNDKDVCAEAVSLLVGLGLRGDSAGSGYAALEMLAKAQQEGDPYAAVILDWVMPGMGGIETAQAIHREQGADVPIILLSAYNWEEVEDAAQQAGISLFVTKPLFKSKLCEVLRAATDLEAHRRKKKEKRSVRVEGRVLLVEDNELNREIAHELISRRGAQVEEAHDGDEAIDMVLKAPEGYYDLVFMDMKMPHMDGVEATREICRRAAEEGLHVPPIVAMTANAFSDDRKSALDAGMSDFLSKPVDVRELDRVLERCLRSVDDGIATKE